jgi:serine protease DegQ
MAVKLLSSGALKIKVGAASVALLLAGYWLAPPRSASLAPSEERAAPLLEEQVQQREAAQPFRGVQDIADRIEVRGVAIHLQTNQTDADNDFVPSRPAGVEAFGVPLGGGFVLTHRRALNGERQVRVAAAESAPLPAQLTAYDEATGLVLLRTDPPLAAAASVATTMPESGSIAVAAARWPGHELILPVFVALVNDSYMRIGGDGGTAAAGLPIFDADGRLIAISLGRGEARPVRAAIDRLLQRAMAGTRAASFGLSFQAVTPPLEPLFGGSGAIIVDVLPGGPAALAGVRPGDVITAIDGTAVSSPGGLRAALLAAPASAPAGFSLRRAGKPLALEVTPIDAFDAAALADRARPQEGVAAAALLAPEQLAAAGIPADARIITVNGRDPAAARRVLARGPAALLVEHGARRYFVLAP